MSERSGASTLAAMTLEEPGAEQASPRAPGPLRCGPCAVWPRQQTWLCAVPLVMGFVGLGLSLMLLKWIVVGSVQDFLPTDLVDPKGSIGQDPIFLSKPSAMPKGPDISTATTTLTASTTAMVSTTTPLAADGTAPPGQTSATTTTASTTTTATVKITAKAQPTTSQPAAPVKPTKTYFLSKANYIGFFLSLSPALAPTLPSLRSEVFKPCVEDKDLAFCLNEGECSIIETVAGVHRHCSGETHESGKSLCSCT
uniref:Neuregulin C-terminal domain-containing protein n=1 Tax=Acanthochromis polyacanthus TaxID=80966 RepID=A0A3Q1FPM8_9TELE